MFEADIFEMELPSGHEEKVLLAVKSELRTRQEKWQDERRKSLRMWWAGFGTLVTAGLAGIYFNRNQKENPDELFVAMDLEELDADQDLFAELDFESDPSQLIEDLEILETEDV